MNPVSIVEAGMVTPVGFSAPASCAAIRCGITGFAETRFMFGGEWLVGCPVPFEEGWRGREKLLRMIVPAVEECLAASEAPAREIPLLLCVAEEGRPGRLPGLDEVFLRDVQGRLGREFHEHSSLIAEGRVGGATALDRARELIGAGRSFCIVAGVDSYLVSGTLNACDARRRLRTERNSDGFIPGEAGAAVLVGRAGEAPIDCLGIGHGREPASVDSGEPLRADGLVEAIRASMTDAGTDWDQLDYRITDLSGEQYRFKEAALALTRLLRLRKEEFDIWHPADCIGEAGAAIVPCVLGIALAATRKAYAPGPGALCHFGADSHERAALVLRSAG